jgi:hypothetical protein
MLVAKVGNFANKHSGITPFALGLQHIRLGIPNEAELAYVSMLFCNYDECVAHQQHDKEIFKFAFKKSVAKHNETCLKALLGNPDVWGMRVIAAHICTLKGKPISPCAIETQQLLKVTKGDKAKEHAAYFDLAIGSRVRLITNLCIPLGVTNGAQGTVTALLFGRDPPSEQAQWLQFESLGVASCNREIPGTHTKT